MFMPVSHHVLLDQIETTILNSFGITQMEVVPAVCCKNSTDWSIFTYHGLHGNVLKPVLLFLTNFEITRNCMILNK